MTSQKDKVFALIEEQTKKSISNDTYDFETLNATHIGIDLHIDRSNVSRILNVLHTEKKLIKQKGRPTLYFSRTAFVKRYPYLSLPVSLEIGDNIKNYLNISEYSLKPQLIESLQTNDLSYDDVLSEAFKKLFPIFFYPNTETRTILLIGEEGVGKKFLLNNIIASAKDSGIIPNNSAILYYKHFNGQDYASSFVTFLDQYSHKNISSICIEIKQTETTIFYNYVQLVEFFYANNNLSLPIITFAIAETQKRVEQSELTPYSVTLPLLKNRSLKNRISIILKLLQTESFRLNKTIVVSKESLLGFLSKEYPLNVRSLKNDLLYAISFSLSHRSGQNSQLELKIDKEQFSEHESKMQEAIPFNEGDIWKKIPSIILLAPNEPFNFDRLMEQEEKLVTDNVPHNHSIKALLCSLPTMIDSEPLSLNAVENKIVTILTDSDLKHDPGLMIGLTQIISKLNDNQLTLDNYTFDKLEKTTSSGEILYKRVLRSLNFKLLDGKKKQVLRTLIHTALDLVTTVKIPVLIASSSHLIDTNYAKYFNTVVNKRLFLTLAPSNQFYKNNTDNNVRVKSISKSMAHVDRGNGTLIVNDFDTKSDEYKSLLLELRNLSFSITFPSVELLTSIIHVITKTDRNIISLSPLLINYRKENSSFFRSNSLTNAKERLLNFSTRSQDIFKNTNSKIITETFYKLLEEIGNTLDFPLTNSLILDFLFLGNCIVDSRFTHKGHPIIEDRYFGRIENDFAFKTIEEHILKITILKNIDLNYAEIVGLYRIIYNHVYQ